jgi:hypothetical protein
VNPRAASSGGAWKDAPHCSRAQKPCWTLFRLAEGFQSFRGYFCKILNWLM